MTRPDAAGHVHRELRVDADLAALRALGPWLAALLADGGADELHGRLELALHEICVNVVDHAYAGAGGALDVVGRVDRGAVELTVTDTGRPFDAATADRAAVGELREHGFGLGIAEQLVDEVRYTRVGEESNRWLLRTGR